MTSATVSPAPTERLPRPAARRRALQLALLLGGLLGLGLLCGGQAHADGTSRSHGSHGSLGSLGSHGSHGSLGSLASRHASVHATVAEPVSVGGADARAPHGRVSGEVRALATDPRAEQTVQSALGAVRPVLGAVQPVLDTVQPVLGTVEQVTRPVLGAVGQVMQPVGDLVGQVAEGVGGTSPLPLPDGPPALPAPPTDPDPGHAIPQPQQPQPQPQQPQPQQPEPAEPAGSTRPAGSAEPATTGGFGESAVPAAAHPVHTPAAESGKQRVRTDAAVQAGPRAFGSARAGFVPMKDARRASTAGHTAMARSAAAQGPAAPAAPSRHNGAPAANASAGDGSSTRHHDLHAAAFGVRVPVLLAPGAFAVGAPAPVADRHRDIPEFPG